MPEPLIHAVVVPPTPQVKPEPVVDAPVVKPVDAGRPAWLPSNFATPEQFADSYKELQAQFTKTKQADAAVVETPVDPVTKAAADKAAAALAADPVAKAAADKAAADKAVEDKKVSDALAAGGIDTDAMSARFWEKGEINPDDNKTLVDALTKAGIKDADKLIKSYADAQLVARDKGVVDTYAAVGGQEAAQPIIAWAQQSLTPAQKAALQPALNSGVPAQVSVALTTLKTMYEAANGKGPAVVLEGGSAGGASTDVYQSQAQVTKDMADQRYRTDPAYRTKVADKLRRSNI